MKHFNKAIMMLTLTALLSQTSSFAQGPSVQEMQKESKGLVADLKAYAKCRKTGDCPQDLLNRMKQRGKYLAIGAGALAAVGLAGVGIYKYAEEPWTTVYPRLKKQFDFIDFASNQALIHGAFDGNERVIDIHVGLADQEAIRAAIFIAEQKGYKDLARKIRKKAGLSE